MRTRAFRRHHQERVILNRVRERYSQWTYFRNPTKTFAKILAEVKAGEIHQEVRTQAVSCSCWTCSKSNKYSKKDRVQNKKVSGVNSSLTFFFIYLEFFISSNCLCFSSKISLVTKFS